MCGIAGIYDTRERRPVDPGLLDAMNQRQFHRGPDEGSIYRQPGVGLAHRRLSIIDIATGQQPMRSADGQQVIVFNGEIYNFQELRSLLVSYGRTFLTHCDTEVILHAWQIWGPECVQRLRGMFAFAIWDQQQDCLFLARDRLGIKPLHYAQLPSGELIFASELKALTLHPQLSDELLPEAIEEYFALGYVPEPNTIYRQVKKLEPGYSLLIKHGQRNLEPHRYWDVVFNSPTAKAQTHTQQSLQDELQEKLDDAVAMRMVSEVPIGAFLSGGVDSSAVVASMAHQTNSKVNTCAIGFDVADFDETQFAASVAQRYHTAHLEREVKSDDFELIDKLAALYDEPFADSSAMPTFRVCQLAKERVTVCLSGDGGDEVFAGYRRYRWHMHEERMRRFMPDSLRQPLFSLLGNLYPKADWAPKFLRAKSTLQGMARNSVQGYFHSLSIMTDAQRHALFSGDLQQQMNGYSALEVFNRHAVCAEKNSNPDALALVQYLDLKTYLPGDILTKVDRASMAHALEVRVPFLDHPLVEWAATLPAETKLHRGEGKLLLKQAMAHRLPHDVLYRRKMGFAVPLSAWFRGPLQHKMQDLLLDGVLANSGLFNCDYIARLLSEHSSGRGEHSATLWSLLMFASFLALPRPKYRVNNQVPEGRYAHSAPA